VHALPFYAAYGFIPVGEVYEEAGIAHRDMRRPL
jgi:predicted GNAT family N-acyltransferase